VSVAQRLDRLQRDRPWAGFPIAVLYKFFDDQGSYLSALIAYYGFLSLFPLLLLLTSVLGFLLAGNPHLEQQILHSALSQFPGIGTQIKSSTGLRAAAPRWWWGCSARCTQPWRGAGDAERDEHRVGGPGQQAA